MGVLTAIGYIFVAIGILVLFGGVINGFSAYNLMSQVPYVGGQLGQSVFLAALVPYAIGSGFLLLVGVVAVYVGSRNSNVEMPTSQATNVSAAYENEVPLPHVEVTPPKVYVQNSPSPSPDDRELHLPKQGVCPSCEFPIVFIEKYQRWYCVNERKYI